MLVVGCWTDRTVVRMGVTRVDPSVLTRRLLGFSSGGSFMNRYSLKVKSSTVVGWEVGKRKKLSGCCRKLGSPRLHVSSRAALPIDGRV